MLNASGSACAGTWQDGAAYDQYMGRWSGAVSGEFVRWLDVSGKGHWLDVGCGTGQLARAILAEADPERVCAVDRSWSFLKFARGTVQDPRVDFTLADATALSGIGGPFNASVSGLVLNFVSDPSAAVTAMGGVTGPGGVVAAYVWDYSGEMWVVRHFWEAAAKEDSTAADWARRQQSSVSSTTELKQVWTEAGLVGVDTRPLDASAVFASFDDYWMPFLCGQGLIGDYLRTHGPTQVYRIRERLRDRLGADDGQITMAIRAWAVKGFRRIPLSATPPRDHRPCLR